MPVAEWDDSLSIGIPKIDLHNQQLFTVLHNLYGRIELQSEYETAQKLAELLDTYTFHIACEEIWMSRSKCEITANHHLDHTRIKQIISEAMGNKNDKASVSLVIAKLTHSFFEHIKEYDVEYARPLGEEDENHLP